MNIALPQPAPAQRAALVLHSMADADREWALQSLAAGEQAALRPLLRELAELGIPRDPELARACPGQAPVQAGDGQGALPALDANAVRRLAAVLVHEPPRLAAALLASRTCPWREPLLRELPVPLAQAIEGESRLPVAPALQTAVLAELARSWGEPSVVQAAQPGPASVWQGIRRRLGAVGVRR